MSDEHEFVARGRSVRVDRPAIMGIVNASPESFSGDGSTAVDVQAAVALQQFVDGALIVDVGGQSANTKSPELDAAVEVARLVPLIEAIRSQSEALISVDTYKPPVADACLAAGADMINDVSALHHPELIDVVARWDAGLVLMHTEGPPKTKILEPGRYTDVVLTVRAFAEETIARLEAGGVPRERVIIDPGIDFAKTPRQSIELMARCDELRSLQRPLLFALSRKDFIGALTATLPRERDPGTLAAVGAVAGAVTNSIVRVHDVAATRQFLDVDWALRHPDEVPADLHLPEELRRT